MFLANICLFYSQNIFVNEVPAVKMYSIEINLLADCLGSGSEELVYGTLYDVCVYVRGREVNI